jgi:hypothetical protein
MCKHVAGAQQQQQQQQQVQPFLQLGRSSGNSDMPAFVAGEHQYWEHQVPSHVAGEHL